MDIVYLVGEGSQWNNKELMYSLRSIEKYCSGVDRVIIVGFLPSFIDETKVVYLPCDDPFGKKHKNMLRKIQKAVNNTDVSDWFIVSSDDHFYVKNTDFETMPMYRKGDLPIKVEEGCKCPGYRSSCIETRALLMAAGYPAINFSQHCGHIFNKTLFKKLEKNLVIASYLVPDGAEPTCIMHNALLKRKLRDYEERRDVKIREFRDEDDLRSQLGNTFCFSIYNQAINCGLEEIFEKWYPNKSKWEK